MRYLSLLLAVVALVFLFSQLPNLNPAVSTEGAEALEVMTAQNAHLIERLDPIGFGQVEEMRFSPDGRWFAVRTTASVVLYNAANWQLEPRVLRVLDQPRAIAFSPDSQKLAVTGCKGYVPHNYSRYAYYCQESESHEWQLNHFEIAPRVYSHGLTNPKFLFYMFLENDPQPILLLVNENSLMLFQDARREIIGDPIVGSWIDTAILSPDLRTLMLRGYDSWKIYSFKQWPQGYTDWLDDYRLSVPNSEQLEQFYFSADSANLIVRGQSSVYVWALQGEQAELLINHPEPLVLSTDMRFASKRSETGYELLHYPDGFVNGNAQQVHLSSPEERYALPRFSPDNRYLVFGRGNSAHNSTEFPDLWLWDIEEDSGTAVSEVYNVQLHHFSPDMSLLAYIDKTHNVHIYDIEQTSDLAVLSGYTQETQRVGFTSEGEITYRSCAARYSYGNGSICEPYSLHLGSERFPLPEEETLSPTNTVLSPDGRLLVTRANPAEVFAVDENGNQELLYSLSTPEEVDIYRILFSPDSRMIVTNMSDQTILLWDSQTGEQLAVLRNNLEAEGDLDFIEVDGMSFSPDGRWLATGTCTWMDATAASSCHKAEVRLWNIEEAVNSGELLATENSRVLRGAQDYLRGLVFSPNGELLVGTGSGPGYDHSGSIELYIWSVETGQLSQILDARTTTQVVFSADGRLLIGNNIEGVVYRWGVSGD
jgi:WD40 repeat protein